jgi:putative DNA-invertase from lambdoid prophage Rac
MPETNPKSSVDQGGKETRVGLYDRASLHGKQTLPMRLDAMRDYARQRGWKIVVEIQDVEVEDDVGSGSALLPKREELLDAARRRDVDLVVVWRLGRWSLSLADLMNTFQELVSLQVGFVSVSEAFDLHTMIGPALTGILAALGEFERERIERCTALAETRARRSSNKINPTPAPLARPA